MLNRYYFSQNDLEKNKERAKEMKKMKKIICVVVVLVLAVSIMSVAASASNTSTITGQDVNLRTGPGTNYDSWGMFNKGDQFECVSESGAWTYGYALKGSRIYNEFKRNVDGYVLSTYLDPGYLG